MANGKYPVEFEYSYYKNNKCRHFITVGEKNGCLAIFDKNAAELYSLQFQKSIELLKDREFIKEIKNWVAAGSRSMVLIDETVPVTGNLVAQILARYTWNMVKLVPNLLEQALPVAFIDWGGVQEERKKIQSDSIEDRYDFVANFIAACANSAYKNAALLDKYGEYLDIGNKYTPYETYRDEILERIKMNNK